ncbi:hypothetical protein B9Z55_004077 [Caenorhabditis nigoni]|uniref:MoaB/Mog domain-containing protein n=1 Tax=Caenorhabditis nigoni TaxID=1611254 RepID=A0A2G5UVN7_9PELO|nr:hypothetical protein B9Z55_004077 [Caenorhabditis nigoni]
MRAIFRATKRMPPGQRKTAAIVVIGDEILKGTTRDTNSHFLCKRLHKLGVNIKKIAVVGDDISEISREVQSASGAYDYVITSGGVGPTHDDKTYLGLAHAFTDQLHFSDEIRQAVNRFLPTYIDKKKSEGVEEGIEEVVRVVTEKLCTVRDPEDSRIPVSAIFRKYKKNPLVWS